MPNVVVAGSPLTEAPAAYRDGTALTGADSDDWTSPIDTAGANASAQPVRGNDTVVVSPRFSVSEATATIVCGLWHLSGSTWTLLGITEITATASADQVDADSKYIGTENIPFALDGATHYEIRVPSVSSGNVVLVPHQVGPKSTGPETV